MCEPECKCHEIEKQINEEFPECNWNMDAACGRWNDRVTEIEATDVAPDPEAEGCCTCPACGRCICAWCS